MSLMLRNSTDAHCVPCSPCLNQPITIQSPIQFVPDANGEREEQQQQHQNMRNRRFRQSNESARRVISTKQRRKQVFTPLLRVAPSTPADPVPSNTPVQCSNFGTPSAEQMVPMCSPYRTPCQDPESHREAQSDESSPLLFKKNSSINRDTKAPSELPSEVNSLELFSGDIFA